jgi:hypothetical protein
VAAAVLLRVLAIGTAVVRPSLAYTLILATSFASLGVARLQIVRTRRALQLMQPGDRTSR